MVKTTGAPRRLAALVAGVSTALLLTACAETSEGGSNGGGDGVDFGATMEEYQEAFADIDPITINTQSSAAQGAPSSRKFEEYFAAVEEWSGGKITFNVQFSNAVAGPTEVDNALNDGRLDLGSILPLFEPAEYPANNDFISSMVVGGQTAEGGLLQLHGWITELGYGTDAIRQEFEDNGMHMLLPAFSSGSSALLCKDEPRNTADAIDGTQVAVASTALSDQVKALGGTPVSLAYTEIFESLQRGVVDCTASILGVAVLGGFIDQAPYVVIDEEVGFAQAPGALAMNKSVWDSLPLVAQQLFFDRLDVFLEANFLATWDNIVEASRQVEAAGGEFVQFDDELSDRFLDENKSILDALRGSSNLGDGDAYIDDAVASSEAWGEVVTELGLDGEPDYNAFVTSYDAASIDLAPYFEKLFQDVLLEYRPS